LIPVVLKIRGIHDGRGDASSSAGGEQPIEPVVAETPQASRVRKHLTDDAPANLGICPQLALDQSDLARGAHCPQVNRPDLRHREFPHHRERLVRSQQLGRLGYQRLESVLISEAGHRTRTPCLALPSDQHRRNLGRGVPATTSGQDATR
jgi:hypothetical protein